MKAIKTKMLLDPLWMAKSRNIDLEYYSFILMAAKQSFDKVIGKSFSNLQEIIFHYLNLHHLRLSGKVYDSLLNEVTDSNVPVIHSGINEKEQTLVEIFDSSQNLISDILINYLNSALNSLSNFEFYFNSLEVHKKDRIYVVFKYAGESTYDIWRLQQNTKHALGFEYSHVLTAEFQEDKPNSFKQKVVTLNSDLTDFDPNHNVLVVICNSKSIKKRECLLLAKNMILVNKTLNMNYYFDSNAMRDLLSTAEKRKNSDITVQPRT